MEVKKLKENKETYQILTVEMEKLSSRIYEDLMSTLVNLSGSLKGIECGTRIKIPIPAGYVNFYKSLESYEMSVWMKESMMETEPIQNLNLNDEV